MTRAVSRFYTDYFPPESAYEMLTEATEGNDTTEAFSPLPISQGPASTSHAPKTKRIFVARIPSNVSEIDLRNYFERYGRIEDAYRPKDVTKNAFRGIGFVTFEDPCVVDVVMSFKHVLGGVEVVVDRATPKEAKEEETMVNNYASMGLHGSFNEQTFDLNFLGCLLPIGGYPNSNGSNRGPPSNISDDWEISNLEKRNRQEAGWKLQRTKGERQQRMTDNSAHVRKVRKGPRIFVGKISKDTVEHDLADYFSQFGFVMDVYIPRSREHKREHRGFGFVTFETEASIKRAISQGTHHLKGAVLAIDVAVPEDA